MNRMFTSIGEPGIQVCARGLRVGPLVGTVTALKGNFRAKIDPDLP